MKEQFVVFYMSQIKKRMTRFMERELEHRGIGELIPTEGQVLSALYHRKGKLMMSEIAEVIGKDKSTVTALIKRLEATGYVSRHKDPADRRITYIQLTPAALAMEGRYKSLSADVVESAFEGFSASERQLFMELIERMHENLTQAETSERAER